MNKIYIAQLGKPNIQWKAWLQALVNSGFELHAVSPLAMELQAFCGRPGDILLLDGMLPRLSRFIQRTCARTPEATVIVATEGDSLPVKHEVMNLDGATYFSGPMSADRFVESIHRVALQDRIAVAS